MDADIQFGELEESRPEVQLRPDQNKHFAVVPFEVPRENDLPIFVDLDVMRDMESHALEDTSVELGGVLLGGQYEDEDGNEFVIVTDSLRAQHYEATKGSFKFTHDTWEQISRERDEFPDDLQMIGWYHTHPDWGVFLSGMDMFICDNFFNKPLDLALVIDPCRGDRGMFMWTGNPSDRIRRTGGFYFMASRHRRHELEVFTCQLEGKLTMPDSRFNPVAGHVGPTPAPVVNLTDSRNQWQALAVVGMLTMQFFVLCLIAWKLIIPAAAEDDEKKTDRLAAIEKKLDASYQSRMQREAYEEILSALVDKIEGEDGLVAKYKDLRLKSELAIQLAENENLIKKELKKEVERYKERGDLYKSDLEHEEKAYDKLKQIESDLRKTIKEKEDEVTMLTKKLKDKVSEKSEDGEENPWYVYVTVAVGAALLLLIVAVLLGTSFRRDEDDEDEDEEMEFKDTVDREDEEPQDKEE